MSTKWYRIKGSIDPKVVGPVSSQTVFAVTPVNSDYPLLSKNIRNTYIADESSVITIKPILEKRARLTDSISGSSNGVGGVQLMISTKLKSILERYAHGRIQFFPLTVIYKNIEISSYWLTNAYAFNPEWIDFKHTKVRLNNYSDYSKARNVEIENLEHFTTMKKQLNWPEGLMIQQLALTGPMDDLFVLADVAGGIGYYVSEKLKYEIEEAECTGLDLEEV